MIHPYYTIKNNTKNKTQETHIPQHDPHTTTHLLPLLQPLLKTAPHHTKQNFLTSAPCYFDFSKQVLLQQNKILYDDKIGLTRPQQAVANQVANKVARQYA